MDVSLDGSTDGFAGRMEILEDRSGRRCRSEEEGTRIAAESLVPGVRVADVARRQEVTRWQVYDWRKKLKAGVQALPAETAKETMGLNPFSGAAFVFRAKRADRIKVLVWDQTGIVLVHKRLEGSRARSS